jgi:hypothetical protein
VGVCALQALLLLLPLLDLTGTHSRSCMFEYSVLQLLLLQLLLILLVQQERIRVPV